MNGIKNIWKVLRIILALIGFAATLIAILWLVCTIILTVQNIANGVIATIETLL